MNQAHAKNSSLFRYERARHVASSEVNLGFGEGNSKYLSVRLLEKINSYHEPLPQLMFSEETLKDATFQEEDTLYESLNPQYVLSFIGQVTFLYYWTLLKIFVLLDSFLKTKFTFLY